MPLERLISYILQSCYSSQRISTFEFSELDCGGIHLTWVKTTYDLLVDVLEATGSHKEADIYRSKVT